LFEVYQFDEQKFQVKLSWKGTFDGNEVCGQLDIEEIGVFRFR